MTGCVEVVCGPMFSGKTEELIRRVRRAQIAKQKIQIFKPALDDRYHETKVVSHSSQSVNAVSVECAIDILKKIYDSTRIVAIDEVQFFDEDIIKVVNKLSRRGVRVILAGLDQDYKGEPFGPIPHLMAIADDVTKVKAVCTSCGAPASKTHRKPSENSDQVLVGEADLYEARCTAHWDFQPKDEDLLAFSVGIDSTDQENLKVQN
ncbi:thymidine kinase [Halobacteriovorax marinus]|uniref:Thymidine kinase n=1 Tax=Halobacteriovorax marinus TaxID=97084 RepID=A0A1Y5FFG1_9BACT|nr:thymidine kinase [Halobacteriovorax marinus]